MASFDSHYHCARCRDKGKGKDFCVENPQSSDCQICKSFTPEQSQQLATPSSPPKESEALVNPATVSVIGAVDDQGAVKSLASVAPPDKKAKKEKSSSTTKKPPQT